MDEKSLYLVAQLDSETHEALSGYYRILREHGFTGTQTKDIPYHFTLGSFEINREGLLPREVEAICQKTGAFDICLGYIGLFGLNVLFIAPNMNFELLGLQKSFFADSAGGCHQWAAHATILMDEPDAILRALPILTQSFKPRAARIESLAVYEVPPARLIGRYKLK